MVKTFIFLGNSNMLGLAALQNVPNETWQRWTGQSTLSLTTYPFDVSCPGINVWQPRLPFRRTAPTAYTTTTFGATTASLTGITLAANQYQDRWCFISTGTQRGQYRRIASNTAGPPAVLTVAAWTSTPAANSTVHVLTDSATITSVSGTSVTISAEGDAYGVNDALLVGKYLIIIGASNASALVQARRITANAATAAGSPDTTVLTIESAFDVTPASGDGVRILGGANSLETMAQYTASGSTRGAFNPLRFYYDLTTSYDTGFDYPNLMSTPEEAPILHYASQRFGPAVECSWQLQQAAGEDIYVIHLAVGGTYLSRFLGQVAASNFSWFTNTQHNDWSPSSTQLLSGTPVYDLFGTLFSTVLPQANAWLATNLSGASIDIQGVFLNVAEIDADVQAYANAVGDAAALLRDKARATIETGNYSTLGKHRIPFVFGGARTTSGVWTYASTANAALQALEGSDPFTGYVDPDQFSVTAGDEAHYDATGQIAYGLALFEKWKEITTRQDSAVQPAQGRDTLATLRAKVLRRYERSDASTDAGVTRVNQFINDSLREVYNTLGNLCWFLRRTEALEVSAAPTINEMPGVIRRLHMLVRSEFQDQEINWSLVGTSNEGKLQVLVTDGFAGSVLAYHFVIPDDLVEDADAVLLPSQYGELAVVLTCKRLAETAGNATMAQYYADSLSNPDYGLWKYVKRDCLRMDSMRTGSLTGMPKWPAATNVYPLAEEW